MEKIWNFLKWLFRGKKETIKKNLLVVKEEPKIITKTETIIKNASFIEVENKDRAFGAATTYIVGKMNLVLIDEPTFLGDVKVAFTKKEIDAAIKRANKNNEDFIEYYSKKSESIDRQS